jgi:hypothetical protein
MLSSFAAFAKYGVLVSIAAVFVIAALALAVNVLRRALSSSDVQIGKFIDLKDSAKDQGPYLLARAQELSRPVPLDALYEVKVPPLTSNFGARDDLKFLDDVKINIQGVDLPAVIRNLYAALPDDQPVVSATPEISTDTDKGSTARLQWKAPSGATRSWLLRSDLPPTDPKATRQIVDQAIYRMVYYMYHDPDGLHYLGKNLGVTFPSARALEAYYAGQERLILYQRTVGSRDSEGRDLGGIALDEAERQFRVLYQEMPHFIDGLMLLGVTLSEKRNEQEAIVVYERVEQELRAKPQPLDAEDQKTLLQARLFKATGLRKLFRWQDNHEALMLLQALEQDIRTLVPELPVELPPYGPQPAAPVALAMTAEQFEYMKIFISVLAERAHGIGLDLVLLNEREFLRALTSNHVPDVVSDDRKAQLAALQQTLATAQGAALEQAKAARAAAFPEVIEEIYQHHASAVRAADYLLGRIGRTDDAWKRARERFVSDLRNAEGYAQYRRAQVLENNDDDFRSRCRQAVSKLNEAHAVRQNEYSILLNLGLVHADPRCDPENKDIETARGFFERSTALKPKDFYGHQQLATLAIRQAHAWGLEFTDAEFMAKAVKEANTARLLRPESGTILALLAQAYILQWAQTTDDSIRKRAEPLIEASLVAAQRENATTIHLQTARLQWLFYRLRNAPDDQFDTMKTKFLAQLHLAAADAAGDRTWYGRKLAQDANVLMQVMLNLQKAEQPRLRWPN